MDIKKKQEFNFKAVEKKWQLRWEKEKAFEVKQDKKKKKYYVLEMFPYPSSSGLHMGHAFNYVIGDIYARFKRMQGANVLYPMGYDSFGLPAENAAIQAGEHPKNYTENAIKNFIKQQKSLGLSYDWSRLLKTSDPEYYKWNQYFFLKLYEKGLVYRKEANVNWCSKCKTVLANEQVHDGKCWRHSDTEVEIKQLEQWSIKITNYADELLRDIEKLDWPERIKIMQRNWIGRSIGTEILFEISENSNYVLLHGYTGSPNKNFFPWLKKELESRGYNVFVPKLPNTNKPNINKQVEHVLKNEKFDENTVLLGHSLGSVVALKVVENLKVKIKKLILAAGFIDSKLISNDKPYKKSFNWKFDFEKIKRNVGEIIILRDLKDTEIRKEQAERIYNALGGNLINFEAGEEHITGNEEPVVLNHCLNKWSTKWKIFTTRPDTLFGVTFMVVSAQHPRLKELVTEKQKKEVEAFLRKIRTTKQEDIDKLEKEGVFTGSYARHPLTNEKIPIYVGNFVLVEYGSGMVMAVPAHDQRDFEFAKKYNLPIKVVINPKVDGRLIKLNAKKLKEAYEGEGYLTNSEGFDHLSSVEAREHITKALEIKNLGKKSVQYKLRDWLISRQRYWGTPIPIIYCDECGIVPVPEKDLPVILPEKVKFGKGNPLETNEKFVNVRCPKCSKKAGRETDTMDTFFDSSWYYLRYCDNKNKEKPFDKNKVEYWLPVNQYIGGAEHAVMHLIYARFFIKVLRDLSFIKINEPFPKLFNQGMLHKDGFVMSKSRGNVVLPEEVSEKYGIDTARLFLVSIASPDKDIEWSSEGIEGSFRFINKVMNYVLNAKIGKTSEKVCHKFNETIKSITNEIENFRYNFAVIKVRKLIDDLDNEISKKDLEGFVKIFSVFCPHVAEELWEKLGNKNFISLEKWPEVDESKINERFDKEEEAMEKTIFDIMNIIKLLKEKQDKVVTKVYIYTLPNELDFYDSKELSSRIGKDVKIFAVNDKNKYDPENKAEKAKPEKPAIFVE